MAQLKIVPKEDWDVLDTYFHRGADVVFVPEEALLNGSLGSIASKVRDLEGYVDYNFGGDPDIRVDILDEFPSFQASELGLGGFDDGEADE